MNNIQTMDAPPGLDVAVPGGALVVQPGDVPAPFAISHIADAYRRYPGEPLTLFTRVEALNAIPGFTVQISLPAGVTPGEYSASANHAGLPELVLAGDDRYLVWRVDRMTEAGERFEFRVQTTVLPTLEDLRLESTALALAADNARAMESLEVAVKAKGSYLKYLPALYYDDELMGRYLMLFESFWRPLEKQIDKIYYYFDPQLTPSSFLPWLATWSDLALDERWTEAQQRKLLASAARLFRIRGTRQGLLEHLEIYTGRKAVITEHRANNLRLGKEAKFGPSIALGRSNRPHSFTVYLRLPPVALAAGEDETLRRRKEQERRRTIDSIIEADKPAHTTYALVIEDEG